MPTINIQKQISPIIIDKQTSSIYICDHMSYREQHIFYYKALINLSNITKLNNTSQYFAYVILVNKSPAKFTVTNEDLANGSYLNKFSRHKIDVSNELKRLSYNNTKIFINKNQLRSTIPYTLEFNIASQSLAADKIFYLKIIEVTSNHITKTLDTISINHNDKLSSYEIPTDNFDFNFTTVSRTSMAIEAYTKDKRIGGFNVFIASINGNLHQRRDFIFIGKIALSQKRAMSNRSFIKNLGSKSLTNSINFSKSIGSIHISLDTDEAYDLRIIPFSSISLSSFGNFKQKIFIGNKKNVLGNVPFYISSKKNNSLKVSILDGPNNAIRFSLHRKNLTLKERGFTEVSSIASVDGSSLFDTGYFDRYDYEYKVSYDTIAGLTRNLTSASQVTHATRLGQNINLSVKKQSVQEIGNNIQVKFTVTANFITSNAIDTLKADLDTLGLSSLFTTDMTNITNNIQPLIKILVSSISTISGVETFIGLFSPGDITVPALIEKTIFKFEVVIRSVPELIESIGANQSSLADNQKKLGGILSQASSLLGQKVSSDITNFTGKFITKSALIDSTLRYGNAAKPIDYDYELGRTGIVSFITVTNNSSPITLTSINAIREFDGIKVKSIIAINSLNNIKYISAQNGINTSFVHPVKSGKLLFFIQSDNNSQDIIITGIGYNNENLFTSKVVI